MRGDPFRRHWPRAGNCVGHRDFVWLPVPPAENKDENPNLAVYRRPPCGFCRAAGAAAIGGWAVTLRHATRPTFMNACSASSFQDDDGETVHCMVSECAPQPCCAGGNASGMCRDAVRSLAERGEATATERGVLSASVRAIDLVPPPSVRVHYKREGRTAPLSPRLPAPVTVAPMAPRTDIKAEARTVVAVSTVATPIAPATMAMPIAPPVHLVDELGGARFHPVQTSRRRAGCA